MQFWENQRAIFSLYNACTKPVCEAFGLSQMEFDILMFLSNNPEYDTASDIVRMRMLTKSHVSTSIKSLEAKELITTAFRNGNHKTVHISLAETSEPIIKAGKDAQILFAQKLFHGFSESDIHCFRELFQRININARLGIEDMKS